MWWFCVLFFVSSCSALPLWGINGRPGLQDFHVQLVKFGGVPIQRHSICLPSPFLGQICIPSALQFFMPMRSPEASQERCLLIPLMRAYTVKVCPSNGTSSRGENLKRTPEEIIKELGKKTEEEFLDNTNIEVNGEEVEPENFVKKENGVESKESKVGDKDVETKNKIIRVSEEIIQVSKEDEEPQQPQFSDKNIDDENLSITSNLV